MVLEELISNSIDSFLIRQHDDPAKRGLAVKVVAEIAATGLLGDGQDLSISCTDNGCGLGDEQTEAFLTKDTSYKDDLTIAGIGKCKGAGRIQFFHHFERVGIRSTYRSDGKVLTRTLPLVAARKKIDLADFGVTDGDAQDIGTTIMLDGLKPATRERLYKNEALGDIFSAANMRRYMLIAFLQRLVSLKSELGDFSITFETRHPKNRVETASLGAADLPLVTEVRVAQVEQRDPRSGDPLGQSTDFTLSHYKLDATAFDLPRNAISFCAKSSPVQDITRRYLRTTAEQNRAVEGFHHIVLVEGELLDRRVNEQRDGFDGIPDEIPVGDLFSDEKVSYAGIFDQIDPIIEAMVSPSGWSRDQVVADVTEKFGVNAGMLADTETRVVYGDTPKSVAERVLRKYQERIIAETAEIFDLREEVEKAEPHTEDFRQKVHMPGQVIVMQALHDDKDAVALLVVEPGQERSIKPIVDGSAQRVRGHLVGLARIVDDDQVCTLAGQRATDRGRVSVPAGGRAEVALGVLFGTDSRAREELAVPVAFHHLPCHRRELRGELLRVADADDLAGRVTTEQPRHQCDGDADRLERSRWHLDDLAPSSLLAGLGGGIADRLQMPVGHQALAGGNLAEHPLHEQVQVLAKHGLQGRAVAHALSPSARRRRKSSISA